MLERLLFTLAICSTTSAMGQSLLTNPGFDTDLGGWVVAPAPAGSVAWTSTDARNRPGSGSAFLADAPCTPIPPSSCVMRPAALSQCVPVTEGRLYSIGLSTLVPAGSSLSGGTRIVWTFYSGPGCTGSALRFGATGARAAHDWQSVLVGAYAIPGAVSARVSVEATRNEEALATPFVSLVDDVVVTDGTPVTEVLPLSPFSLAAFAALCAAAGVGVLAKGSAA